MESNKCTRKRKALSAIRVFMYLDVLLIVFCLAIFDLENLALQANAAKYLGLLILIVAFFVLNSSEKKISRYLRKNRE